MGERSRGVSSDITEHNSNICNSLQNFCYVNKMHSDLWMTIKFLSLVAKHVSKGHWQDDQDDDLPRSQVQLGVGVVKMESFHVATVN